MLFVSIAHAASTVPLAPQLTFTTEHIITGVLASLASFALMGVAAPLYVAYRNRKTEERDENLKQALKERDDARMQIDQQWHEDVKRLFKEQKDAFENHGHQATAVCNNETCKLNVETKKVYTIR
jgi:hypothetical protein